VGPPQSLLLPWNTWSHITGEGMARWMVEVGGSSGWRLGSPHSPLILGPIFIKAKSRAIYVEREGDLLVLYSPKKFVRKYLLKYQTKSKTLVPTISTFCICLLHRPIFFPLTFWTFDTMWTFILLIFLAGIWNKPLR